MFGSFLNAMLSVVGAYVTTIVVLESLETIAALKAQADEATA